MCSHPEICQPKLDGHVDFVEEKVSGAKPWKQRKIKEVIDELGEGYRLIVKGTVTVGPIPAGDHGNHGRSKREGHRRL